MFGSTLVVKIKKNRNPLRAFTEDKENIILLPVDWGLSFGVSVCRLGSIHNGAELTLLFVPARNTALASKPVKKGGVVS